MNRFREPGARLLIRTIAVFCVALVLVATTAEAGHSCEPIPVSAGNQTSIAAAQVSPGAPCLLCVGAHTPGVAATISPIVPDVAVSAMATPALFSHRHAVESFALYVRPPPVS